MATEIFTSGDLFIWGRNTLYCLYPDNVVFYHPCNDYIEDTLQEPWTENGVIPFSDGLVSSGITMSGTRTVVSYDNQTGGYPSLEGATSMAMAFWSKYFFRTGPDADLGVCNSSDPSGIALHDGLHVHGQNGKPHIHLNGVKGKTVGSLNPTPTDDDWHFTVIYAEMSGGNWHIYGSIDGGNLDYLTNDTSSTTPMSGQRYLVIELEDPNEDSPPPIIDEVICWAGLTAPFTQEEIHNMYDLGYIHNLQMDANRTHQEKGGSADLFIHGWDNIEASGNLFIEGAIEVSGALAPPLYIYGYNTVQASGDLFVESHMPTITSGNLYIYGYDNTIASGDLFIHGLNNINTSGNLFIEGHIDSSGIPAPSLFVHGYDTIFVSGDLFVHGHETLSTSGDLFICGIVPEPLSTSSNVRPLDWLLKTQDHNPQIIGSFDMFASSATIQVWDVTNGQNTSMTLVESGCYAIGNTGRWGWSTVNLPTSQGYDRHYFYQMTSNFGEIFEGQLILNIPEGAKWAHPGSQSEYLV